MLLKLRFETKCITTKISDKVKEMLDPKNRTVNNPHIVIEDKYAIEYLQHIPLMETDRSNLIYAVDIDFSIERDIEFFIREMKYLGWSKLTRIDNCFLLRADVVLR